MHQEPRVSYLLPVCAFVYPKFDEVRKTFLLYLPLVVTKSEKAEEKQFVEGSSMTGVYAGFTDVSLVSWR